MEKDLSNGIGEKTLRSDEGSSREPSGSVRLAANEANLMDWDNGLVGWETVKDPENPLCDSL